MKRFKRIFQYISHYKGKLFLYLLCTLLTTIFSLFSLGMLAPFMDMIFKGGSSGTTAETINSNAVGAFIANFLNDMIHTHGAVFALGVICIFFVVAILLKNLFLYLSYYISTPVRNSIVTRLRNDMFDKILVLPVIFFNEKRKGDVISRMTNDVAEIESSVVSALEGLIKDPLTIMAFLVYMVYLSPTLSLFLLVLLPVTGFIIGRVSRSLKKQSQTAAIKLGELLSILEETLGGIRVIKAFLAENLMKSNFKYVNNSIFRLRNKMNLRRDLASPFTEFLAIGVLCTVLYLGGRLVLTGTSMAAGDLIAYLAVFAMMINPAKTLSTNFFNMQRGAAAIDRVEELLNAPIIVEETGTKELEDFHGSIEFKNVSFAYGEHQILHNINLSIPKGKTVALVGSSGAGKSTLADLIPRFHDVTSGELLIDGVNLKDYNLASVRKCISIVTQEPILFNDTITNNIKMGKNNASNEEIEAAAKVANAYNFISQKEDGFETNIGDRGSKLSGGERQRLTIARAVIKNPPILILDEATSSLDTESERQVQEAINNMMQNRTCVVIAHRLSTIRHADEIIVLQKGEIAERGTHEVLMEKKGIYHKLVEMQEVK